MHGNGLARTPCLSIPLTFSLGYIFRKPNSAITRQALTWNHQCKRKRGGQQTLRRDFDEDIMQTGLRWKQLATIAQDRIH